MTTATAMKENRVDATLRQLIQDYGTELIENRKQLEGLLKDLCGSSRRLINVVMVAHKERIPEKILAIEEPIIDNLEFFNISKKFESDTGLEKNLAQWGIKAWIEALGKSVRTNQQPKTETDTKKSKKSISVQKRTPYKKLADERLITIKPYQRYGDHDNQVVSIAIAPDSVRYASGGRDQKVILRNLRTGEILLTIDDLESWPFDLDISPDGSLIAIGGNHAEIRELETGHKKFVFRYAESTILSVAFSPDGNYLAGGLSDGKIKLWSVEDGREVTELPGHKDSVFSIHFSYTGEYIASASRDKAVKIFDLNDGREVATFRDHKDWVYAVAFSQDEQWIASGGFDDVLRVRNLENREEIHVFTQHSNSVMSVSFSHNCEYIISGSQDESVRVQRLSNTSEIWPLTKHNAEVNKLKVSKDGKYLVLGLDDCTVYIYQLVFLQPHTIELYWQIEREKKLAIEKMMIKDEFETTREYADRVKTESEAIEREYEELFEQKKVLLESEMQQTIQKSIQEVNLPIERIGKYNADNETFLITIAGVSKYVHIPLADAKTFKANWRKSKVKAIRRLNKDLSEYELDDVIIFHPTNNAKYKF